MALIPHMRAGASKAAVRNLTNTVAIDFTEQCLEIRCSLIHPAPS